MSGKRLLIVGASGRAAAASAMRAGFEPFVIDLFADADTKRLSPVLKCSMGEYPAGLVRLAEQAPPGPWMYTGGLENHPEVVGAISERRELWGNGPEVLRQVRDPLVLDRVPSHVAGFAEPQRPPAEWRFGWPERDCVRKPLRGAGGKGIRFARRDDTAHPDFYYQEFVPGEPLSSVCFAASAQSVTLGISLQLIGTDWLHAREFQYAGNVRRPRIDNPVYSWDWDLCQTTGLRGLFGLDFIGGEPGANWGHRVIEVNPRYVASLEVHEFATNASLLRRTTPPPPAVRVVGKAIYYAPTRLTFPASGPWDESLRRCTDVWRRPDYADIPDPDAVIDAGHPVLTLLADGATEAAVVDTLKERAGELDRLFVRPR